MNSLGKPGFALSAILAVVVSPVLAEGPAPAACCASLAEVRANIDRIDTDLLALMAERTRYVAEAARFKPDRARVHDGARVEQIIARIRGLAAEKGLPPDVAEATWRAMIAAFTRYEEGLVKP